MNPCLAENSLAKESPELPIFLPLLPRCWNCRHEPPGLLSAGGQTESFMRARQACCTLTASLAWRKRRDG